MAGEKINAILHLTLKRALVTCSYHTLERFQQIASSVQLYIVPRPLDSIKSVVKPKMHGWRWVSTGNYIHTS